MDTKNSIREIVRRRQQEDKAVVVCTQAELDKAITQKRKEFENRSIRINGTDVRIGMSVGKNWSFADTTEELTDVWATVMWVNPNKKAKVGERIVVLVKEEPALTFDEARRYCKTYHKNGVQVGEGFLLAPKDWNLFMMDEVTPCKENMEANGIWSGYNYWTAEEVDPFYAMVFRHTCYRSFDDGKFDFFEYHKSKIRRVKCAVRY